MLTPDRSDISAGVSQSLMSFSISPPNNLGCTPGQPRDVLLDLQTPERGHGTAGLGVVSWRRRAR